MLNLDWLLALAQGVTVTNSHNHLSESKRQYRQYQRKVHKRGQEGLDQQSHGVHHYPFHNHFLNLILETGGQLEDAGALPLEKERLVVYVDVRPRARLLLWIVSDT